MPRELVTCWVCGSSDCKRESDYLDGHTLLECEDNCPLCGYFRHFAYGHTSESLGRYYAEWGWMVSAAEEWARAAAFKVAVLARRGCLGLLGPEEAGFAAVLAKDPADFTAAKVYADWLQERGREAEAHYFREYNDASYFDTAKVEG